MEYPEPGFDPPYRVIVLIAATEGWYVADRAEREAATDELARLLSETEERGARLLASFDDDLFLTGQPAPLPYTIHILYDVDDLALVVGLVHRLRTSESRAVPAARGAYRPTALRARPLIRRQATASILPLPPRYRSTTFGSRRSSGPGPSKRVWPVSST